jgi:hypothetical protein
LAVTTSQFALVATRRPDGTFEVTQAVSLLTTKQFQENVQPVTRRPLHNEELFCIAESFAVSVQNAARIEAE